MGGWLRFSCVSSASCENTFEADSHRMHPVPSHAGVPTRRTLLPAGHLAFGDNPRTALKDATFGSVRLDDPLACAPGAEPSRERFDSTPGRKALCDRTEQNRKWSEAERGPNPYHT